MCALMSIIDDAEERQWKSDKDKITLILYDKDIDAEQCIIAEKNEETTQFEPTSVSSSMASSSTPATTSLSTTASTTTAPTTPPPVHSHILIFAGRGASGNKDDIIDFDPATSSITVLSIKMAQPGHHRGVAVWGDKVVVNGYYFHSGEASFEVFDTSSSPLVSLTTPVVPQARSLACSGVVGGKFYSCFGQSGSSVVSTCDVYDLSNNYAHSSFGFGIAFRSAASVFKDNYVFTVGGKDAGNSVTNDVYKFDLNSHVNIALTSYSQRVYGASAVLYQGNMVVCGGKNSGGSYLDMCKLYDFNSDLWTSFPSLKAPMYYHSLVNWGADIIVCIGGTGPSGYVDLVQLYENGSWTNSATLPYPMHGAKSVELFK